MKTLLMLVGALLVAASLSAQTVVNPHELVFQPSLDHNLKDFAGNDLVTSYEWTIETMNGTGALFLTVGLTKPVLTDLNADVILPLPGLASLVVDTLYLGKVYAKGPNGTSGAATTSPFGNAASQAAPKPPRNARVR